VSYLGCSFGIKGFSLLNWSPSFDKIHFALVGGVRLLRAAPGDELLDLRKNVIAAKLAANKKNARQSTGPNATRGRVSVKKNGLKYGVFSRDSRKTT
jgi:hypothetical protein